MSPTRVSGGKFEGCLPSEDLEPTYQTTHVAAAIPNIYAESFVECLIYFVSAL